MNRFLFLIMLCATPAANASETSDEVVAFMRKTWDKPGHPIQIMATASSKTHALVSWSQGDISGRAILAKGTSDDWNVKACTGALALDEKTLEEMGFSEEEAKRLVASLIEQEKHLSAKERDKLDNFRMDSTQNH